MSVQIKTDDGWIKVAGKGLDGKDGTNDYSQLEFKPKINGVTLMGQLSALELNLVDYFTYSGLETRVDSLETIVGQANALLEGV